MKKWKESLFFIIPLLAVTGLLAVLLSRPNNRYLWTMFGEAAFWVFFLRTYGKALAFAFLPILLFAFLRYGVKSRLLRNVPFCSLMNGLLGSVFALIVFAAERVCIFGLPMEAYEPHTLIDSTILLSWRITGLDIAAALHVGILTAFVLWIAERLLSRRKRPKAEPGEE